MELEIIHETQYKYGQEVFFEPHYFRFKPRDTSYATLKKFKLQVTPEPAGIAEQTDAEDNKIHFCWYEGMHTTLTILSKSVLSIVEYNPYNFILWPSDSNQLPFHYGDQLRKLLKPYLEVKQFNEPLQQYVDAILRTNTEIIPFLSELTRRIQADFTLETREIGEPHTPNKTFELKRGSCRDLAWMHIQLLRHLGIAARFVSGYYYIQADNPIYELHAWTEVFLPGAGWIGYDPSNGIRTTNRHFPICSSCNYQNTMPVTGTVRGGASSVLKTDLKINLLKS